MQTPNNSSGNTKSIWLDTAPQPALSPLSSSLTADVCVIGGGISGLTTAYLLMKAGNSVIVLEDGKIGSGETGRTSGHLSNALDDRYFNLEQAHGENGARLAAQSHTAAIDTIEKIVRDEKIQCDFRRVDGFLFLGKDDKQETLDKELTAARKAGLKTVKPSPQLLVGSNDFGSNLVFPNQAQFHAMKYLSGLTKAIVDGGGKIFDRTHVLTVEDGEPCTVTTQAGKTVKSNSVVAATNNPVANGFIIQTKEMAYRSYVIGMSIPKATVPEALYWDTTDPYHYVRLQDEVLIVGGEDHKTGQDNDPDAHYANLETWTREKFPMAEKVLYRWSGQILEPADGMAYIGRNPGEKNVYIVTGDSGNGLTHGTIGGLLIADLIAGRKNEWESLYNPSRVPHALGEYAKENANTLAQYTDWLKGGDVKSADEIPNGEGAVIQHGLKKVATYKDTRGNICEYSAVCPHLGAILHWNSGEKTWDCPAHGSRFDRKGKILNGPANTDLEEVTIEPKSKTKVLK